ncbi:MAG: DUF2797 domain-containing protein [Candidatus Heimdallarchaeota archaeon]|nr:DUF2797 domain-containing protein [Candidatus Heimdallarchaeota archaeon]
MDAFIQLFGWKMKPHPEPYILFTEHGSEQDNILFLKKGKSVTIKVEPEQEKFCVGFSNSVRKHVTCPTVEVLPLNRVQCQRCALSEFYICKAICQGDFCHPSSEEANEYCWRTLAHVYLTHIAGRIKVGSSTNPMRRWIGQGSDAGISVAVGVGLAPRALEQQISTKFSLPLAVRISQKMKSIGKEINKDQVKNELQSIIDEIYATMKSEILIPKKELDSVVFLDKYYSDIHSLTAQPLVLKLDKTGLDISGKIVGVKGSILIVKNVETHYALNLDSLVGIQAHLSQDYEEMKGQKSLFDFV